MTTRVINSFISLPLKWHLLIGFLVRVCLIFYGDFMDSFSKVPYTDVDYKVFTDAARHVTNGESPYERHTYRYSPLIAILLVPNIILAHNFGKFLFSSIDILVGVLIYKIVAQYLKNTYFCSKKSTLKLNCSTLLWIYNPMSVIIATRGNSDSLSALFVLTTLYLLYVKRAYFLTGLVHGLSCHFRVYPIIYSLALFMHLSKFSIGYFENNPKTDSKELVLSKPNEIVSVQDVSVRGKSKKRTIFQKKYLYYLLPNVNQLYLIFGTILSFSILLLFFYYLYGYTFLYETYLYHLLRKDIRHNFSIYFYLQYLTSDIKNLGIWHKVLIVLPNLILLLVISVRYGLRRECIFFSIFAQTYVFVSYNTVITSQYFIWFLSLLPLVVWHVQFDGWMWLKMGMMWLLGQLAWLLPAALLEFNGQNTFLLVWLQSVAFFCANIIILSRFIKYFSPILIDKSE